MELLRQQVEALIFCSEQNISLEEIAASLKISFDWDLEDAEILSVIEEIKEKYSSDEYAFELLEISDGYQFLTKKHYHPTVSALIQHKAKKKLSISQMETLAIIAYRQPISKSEVEHIRGVSCDYAIQKLLEKELIEISGKSDGPGRPILYSTSRLFMDYFGIRTVKDLPQLKDLHMEQNEIGIPSEESSDDDDFNRGDNAEPFEEIKDKDEVEEVNALNDNEEESFHTENDNNDFSELPDRKTIFLENEIKNQVEEEIDPRNDEFENLS